MPCVHRAVSPAPLVVAHTSNPNAREVGARRTRSSNRPWPLTGLKANLGHREPCFQILNLKKKKAILLLLLPFLILAGDVAPVVEYLPNVWESPGSVPSPT